MEEPKDKTTFDNKCAIIGELWMSYRGDSQFEDFISYNDLGLPLGFLIAENLVRPNELAKSMVDETFDLLLSALEREDTGFESLDDVFVG
jgi:hypothetical protein